MSSDRPDSLTFLLTKATPESTIELNLPAARALRDELASLEARNAALEQDARRYRWLREQRDIAIWDYRQPRREVFMGRMEALDRNIDAALASVEPQTNERM